MFEAYSTSMQKTLLEIYAANPELLAERAEVIKYYSFFRGKAENDEDVKNEWARGQSWEIPDEGLDYIPTRDIRNHTKKLLRKQMRFMFGAKPDVLYKPVNKEDKDLAESKRTVTDQILEDASFWAATNKAFLDSTIGKRVLLMVVANPGEPIKFRYYTMTEFTYKTDPRDTSKLTEVIVAYPDKGTLALPADKQIWYRYKYWFKSEKDVWFQGGTYDGEARPISISTKSTGLDELPFRVIINGGLTGDTEGTSDVWDLMDMAMAYNKTTSDFRDALRFKMFEQPTFTDADSDSLANIKIAPNAIIDLKTDPAVEGKQAQASMLSSTFSFTEAVDNYVKGLKDDMCEIMDQPRPEQLQDVPSGKALKFMFYDLIARCEEKWLEWEPAIKWAIKFSWKCIEKWNLHEDLEAAKYVKVAAILNLRHNYPIPEDEDEKKKVGIEEVKASVRSHRSYIRDFSEIEDEDVEWQEIIDESTEITGSLQDQFAAGAEDDMGGSAGGSGFGDGKGAKGDKTKGNKGDKGKGGTEE